MPTSSGSVCTDSHGPKVNHIGCATLFLFSGSIRLDGNSNSVPGAIPVQARTTLQFNSGNAILSVCALKFASVVPGSAAPTQWILVRVGHTA